MLHSAVLMGCEGLHDQKRLWRRWLAPAMATGCEPGQGRKEAAVAAELGVGIGLAGAVSILLSDIVLASLCISAARRRITFL